LNLNKLSLNCNLEQRAQVLVSIISSGNDKHTPNPVKVYSNFYLRKRSSPKKE
jgi:hypothetical protein